ncbi:MAG: Ku protein [Pseudomonadota bacterium]
MPRIIWKGAISFGLVHVPVALYPASQEVAVDFDWLDQRTMDPVGYQRINKRTGKAITKEHVVKGVKLDDGQYVVLSDDEIKAAFPKSTQTIAIEAFVKAPEIDFFLLERPYYLEPLGKAQRVYALLREAMRDAGVMGIARLVMHSKEHLALLIPTADALVLNTIRWSTELRSATELALPPAGKTTNQLKPAELKMAAQLIEEMTTPWHSDAYADTFATAIDELVKQKVGAGKTQQVTPLEASDDGVKVSNVVDLTELLAKSLQGKKAGSSKAADTKAAPSKSAAKTPAVKRKRA